MKDIDDSRAPLLEHLIELRRRLLWSLVALAQYARSLSISPTHAQTLYNVGIVRADGIHDYPGAVAAWEKLLESSPAYPNAAAVRELLAEARLKSAVVRQ